MAETPPSNEAFFREVDDAVRQDRLTSLWRRFGRWIVLLVIAGLAAFGGWLYWTHYSREQSGEVAEQAQDVLRSLAAGNAPDEEKLKALAAADQPGYRGMTTLVQAAAAARKGDIKGAARLYGEIAANQELARPYRDLGTIRQVALTFDTMQPQQVVDRLKPLAVEGGPWFGSAAEMTAIAYMKMGKKELAGPLFGAIAKDPQAPATLRSRAGQMAGLLGIDAVDIEDNAGGETPNGKDEGDNAATSE